MTVTSFIAQVPEWLTLIALFVTSLCIAATAVARFTASKVDDEYVSKFTSYVLKVVAYLPTFGVNPRTKHLEETIKELKAEQIAIEAATKVLATEPVTGGAADAVKKVN